MHAIIPTLRKAIRAVALLVLAAACSDRSEGPRVPEGGPDLGAPNIPWAKKNRDERMAYMGAHVYPAMKKLFQEFDPALYSDFSCQTCHGTDMEARDYAMPGDLYELPGDDPIADAMDYDEDIANFMKGKVAPTMSHLLSQNVSVATACFTCHPKSE
jgi:hypothetical protein